MVCRLFLSTIVDKIVKTVHCRVTTKRGFCDRMEPGSRSLRKLTFKRKKHIIESEELQMTDKKHRTDNGVGANREYKDTLFRKIFGSEENRKYLLSLYNSINHSDYQSPEELEIVTMEDVLYVSMKNDVAFLLDSEINLYEHQSTINRNMPVRGFLYAAKLMQDWMAKHHQNLYQKKQIKLPTPKYVVFYNGQEPMEDRVELRLSDAFIKPVREGTYEWTADVYNINFGRNRELMESCQALKQYADFVRMVREYARESKSNDLKIAIWKAMDVAIQKNYLDGYFEREKEEVFMTTLFEVDRDVYENDIREEARQEGLEQGLERGQEETELKMLERYMQKHDVDFDEAFDDLDLPEERYLEYRDKIEERGNVPMEGYPERGRSR